MKIEIHYMEHLKKRNSLGRECQPAGGDAGGDEPLALLTAVVFRV